MRLPHFQTQMRFVLSYESGTLRMSDHTNAKHSVAGQKEGAPIEVNRLHCAAYELHDLFTYYAILLGLRFGCYYFVASIRATS